MSALTSSSTTNGYAKPKRRLKRSVKRLEYRTKLGIKVPLRGYQRQAVRVGVENPHYALLMAPRLGKTRVDIAVAGYRFLQGEIDRWIIVAPSIAKSVWVREIRASLSVPHVVEAVEGPAEERRLLVRGWKDVLGSLSILVINPEGTWRLKKWLYKWTSAGRTKSTVDESHRIKNHTAKQSVSCHTLGRRSEYTCIMTGTLMTTPMDVFSQYKYLDPAIFGDRIQSFRDRYVRTYGYMGKKPKTFKNTDELKEKIESVAFVLDRRGAGGFPQEDYGNIEFDISGKTRRHYDEMDEELKTVIDGAEVSASVILTKVLRMQQILAGYLPVQDPDDPRVSTATPVGTDRISAFREFLKDYARDTPLVVMARFRFEIAAIEAALKQVGRSFGTIIGGMKPQDRDAVKDRFQEGKVSTCVSQIRAGGISIELSRADTLLFYSMTTSYIDYEQALARIISRRGGSVSILHLIARGTVDEDTLRAVRERKQVEEILLASRKLA